jgi:uncharacterized spore protein YtfJ
MTYPTFKPSFNFPLPIDRDRDRSGNSFPADLVSGKGFYTQIEFVNYTGSLQFNSYGIANPSAGGGIKLPIPQKLNDNLILHWSTPSFTDAALGALNNVASGFGTLGRTVASGIGLGAQLGGIGLGVALNPLMFLQFQRPEYRQFSLSWFLAPRNELESKAIKQIITKCKQAASPNKGPIPFTLSYPQVAMIKMHPNNLNGHMVFKPCVITSVQANYTGGPVPAFYKSGAPALVTLTLNLMEMQFWFGKEIK